MARRCNVAERMAIEQYALLGFKPVSRGWPDFLFYNDEGKVIMVEVKSGNKKLKGSQQFVREVLMRHFEYRIFRANIPTHKRVIPRETLRKGDREDE